MLFEDVITELRDLNEAVPIPIRLPTDAEVNVSEAELGVKFHPDFRRYLLEVSDIVFGPLEPVTITNPASHTHLSRVARHAWSDWGVSEDLVPICHDNADFYCVTSDGRVVYWAHDIRNLSGTEWPSVAAWIKGVWIEETKAL